MKNMLLKPVRRPLPQEGLPTNPMTMYKKPTSQLSRVPYLHPPEATPLQMYLTQLVKLELSVMLT